MVQFLCARRALCSEPKVCCCCLGNKFYLYYKFVYRMVHAFTCAGMLLSRYTHLSMFSGIGLLVMLTSAKVCLFMFCKCMYMYLLSTSVYQKLGYTVLVGRAAEPSMRASVEEVQALPDYSTKGELPYKCYGFIITIIQL